jgi:hypothetical protein
LITLWNRPWLKPIVSRNGILPSEVSGIHKWHQHIPCHSVVQNVLRYIFQCAISTCLIRWPDLSQHPQGKTLHKQKGPYCRQYNCKLSSFFLVHPTRPYQSFFSDVYYRPKMCISGPKVITIFRLQKKFIRRIPTIAICKIEKK